eukprot:m.118546 g.118546  ORF g.118546 m.118546 type:complete len:66 (+) comp16434_c0_seq4:2040-2237(+)
MPKRALLNHFKPGAALELPYANGDQASGVADAIRAWKTSAMATATTHDQAIAAISAWGGALHQDC